MNASFKLSRVNNRRGWKGIYINITITYTSKRGTTCSNYLDNEGPTEWKAAAAPVYVGEDWLSVCSRF